jgi:DNA-binding transcriptional LysR family regulator
VDWNDGRLFLAVARAGQMLGAARSLGLSQATLSRRIAALEKALGAELLVRRTTGCELTGDGAALIPSLERMEAEMIQARARLQRAGTGPEGTVRIGAPDGFGVGFLAPALARLAERHPGLVVQLVPVPRAFSLSQREADVAVMVGRPEQGRLIARKLTDYSLRLYAARGYFLNREPPREAGDLRQHRLIGYVEDLIFAPSLTYAGEFLRNWTSALEIASAMGQLAAIRAGAGIGVLHDYLAQEEPGLVPVLPELRALRSYWTVYHESLRDVARVQAVVRFLNDLVREVPSRFVT